MNWAIALQNGERLSSDLWKEPPPEWLVSTCMNSAS